MCKVLVRLMGLGAAQGEPCGRSYQAGRLSSAKPRSTAHMAYAPFRAVPIWAYLKSTSNPHGSSGGSPEANIIFGAVISDNLGDKCVSP